MITGNKGEWSEIYVLFKLLADGKVYAADSTLNKLDDIYFPILKIIREEILGEFKEYITGDCIEIYVNGKKINSIDKYKFDEEATFLLDGIKSSKGLSFSIERSEQFMNEVSCYKLKAPASDKSDITMKILDINTGYSPTVGFSIKSELGSAPTLLNAGKTTNFVFKICHDRLDLLEKTNSICKISRGKQSVDLKGRINYVIDEGGRFEYVGMKNKTFNDNLILIDSAMDKIIAETLLYFYRDGIINCEDMISKIEIENPMNYGNVNAYRYKFKKFLTAIALGMKPATEWSGVDEATGGYIVVTKEGNVLAYHIYNRNYFEEYLLRNTKYETASTSRHGFGKVYSEAEQDYMNLNLQIRFK